VDAEPLHLDADRAFAALEASFDRLEEGLWTEGWRLWPNRLGIHFRDFRPVVLMNEDWFHEACNAGKVTEGERLEVLKLDFIALGKEHSAPLAEDVLAAVELAARVEATDVQQAERRAAMLTKTGIRAVPVVSGLEIAPSVEREAARLGVVVILDRRDH
jgi:hypothetical protein